MKSSVVPGFKCGLELCCFKDRDNILKQFPRTSEQTVSGKKDKDTSKNEQILGEFLTAKLRNFCRKK